MVEREGFAFPVSMEYENLPEFCTQCKSIGHNVNSCRWLHSRKVDKQADTLIMERSLLITKNKELSGNQKIIRMELVLRLPLKRISQRKSNRKKL